MKKLTIKINNKQLEVAPKDLKSDWYYAPELIKKELGKDWRLPTKNELNEMYIQLYKKGVGGFTYDYHYYWSSSEGNGNYAWLQYFYSGGQYCASKDYSRYVRAVRAFKEKKHIKFNKSKLEPISGDISLKERYAEAKQRVVDIENEINNPQMEFDFVEWCENSEHDGWLDNQDLIELSYYRDQYDFDSEDLKTNSHHLAEKIITWQIEKYIEKYDKGWTPDWENARQIKHCFKLNNNSAIIGGTCYSQSLPSAFYFSEKVAEKIKDLPEILEREYGVCIFKYWLTGER